MNGLYKEFQLSAPLNQFIDCVWKENYSKYLSKQDRSFLVIPDNTVELIFTSNAIERHLVNTTSSHAVKSHVSGLKTMPQQIKLSGEVLLSVRFKPYGLYPFSNIDFSETINQSIEPRELFGPDIVTLEAQLFDCKTELEQVRLIETFFLKKLYQNAIERDEVFDFLTQEIINSKGTIGITQLSEEFNISKKTIERKFMSKLGISPKKYSRIVRLFNALRIPENDDLNFIHIASDNGFYDQAHFIKEVKVFTGMTPKEYFNIDRTIQANIFKP